MTLRIRFLWVWTLPLWGGVGGGLLSSCDDTPDLYHEYQSTDVRGWQRSDTLTFEFTPRTSGKKSTPNVGEIKGALSVAVRTLDTYPYRHLPLRIEVEELLPLLRRTTIVRQMSPDSVLLHADTIRCRRPSARHSPAPHPARAARRHPPPQFRPAPPLAHQPPSARPRAAGYHRHRRASPAGNASSMIGRGKRKGRKTKKITQLSHVFFSRRNLRNTQKKDEELVVKIIKRRLFFKDNSDNLKQLFYSFPRISEISA